MIVLAVLLVFLAIIADANIVYWNFGQLEEVSLQHWMYQFAIGYSLFLFILDPIVVNFVWVCKYKKLQNEEAKQIEYTEQQVSTARVHPIRDPSDDSIISSDTVDDNFRPGTVYHGYPRDRQNYIGFKQGNQSANKAQGNQNELGTRKGVGDNIGQKTFEYYKKAAELQDSYIRKGNIQNNL